MAEITANVNWIAVVAGFVLSFLLGWLWYSPKLFGTKWAEGVGIDLSAASGVPAKAMITQAVATFLLSWVVGVTVANNAPYTLILIVLTIITLMKASGFFSQKSTYAIATETGFVAAMAVIMVICQTFL